MFSDPVIVVEDVSKTFDIYDKPQDQLIKMLSGGTRDRSRKFTALRNVSLEIPKGETFGIVGKNGSGKSTLLQIIAGTLSPSSGIVKVDGRVAALLELGSGFNPDFTGRENVYMNATILGLSKSEIDDLFPDIVAFADIGDFIDQPTKTYSSGMALRLAFAVQALAPKEVLIVDEALAVGDELFQRKCYAKIEEFKKSGGTILFVSHSASAVVELCDRAMLLDEGECVIIGESKRVVNLYQKIMYAPPEKRHELKNEIRESVISQDAAPLVIKTAKPEADGTREESEGVEYLDQALMVSENFHYERQGARIYDAKILTVSGQGVNHLVKNRKYLWTYSVEFERRAENVRFGMLIKTTSGYELGGGTSARQSGGLEVVERGDIVRVEFEFISRLNGGIYFINGGVLGAVDGVEIYLDRAIDIGVFRVLESPNSTATMLIDFGISSNIYRQQRRYQSGGSYLD